MSRRRAAVKRTVLPDPIFGDEIVTKFICTMMIDGKRSTAERQFYGALEIIKGKTPEKFDGCKSSLEVFKLAVENVKPLLEVRSRRVGGANYQIPFEVKGQRQTHLTLMWFTAAARSRKGMSMEDRLAIEFVDAYNNTGTAVKKKEDTHKMADANRAFAHFARF